MEELSYELKAQGIDLTYFNYLDEDVLVIADAEQLKRVINNIVSNSIKYMNKEKGVINIRLKGRRGFYSGGDRGQRKGHCPERSA